MPHAPTMELPSGWELGGAYCCRREMCQISTHNMQAAMFRVCSRWSCLSGSWAARNPSLPKTSGRTLLAVKLPFLSAGGHVPSTPALELLEWELGGAVLAALTPALPPGSEDDGSNAGSSNAAGGGGGGAPTSRAPLGQRLSERGVLQLLFDTGLLRAALAGGRPAAADSAGAASEGLQRCALGKGCSAEQFRGNSGGFWTCAGG